MDEVLLGEQLGELELQELEELYASLSNYDATPVSIEEFLHNPEFLGDYFQGTLYDYWEDTLIKIFPSPFYSPYWLCCIRGAIGLGKTTIACTGMAYNLHKLLCMANPQSSFGLVPTTKIVFAIFNATLGLATDVVWDQLTQIFMTSPYFREILGPLGVKRNKKIRDTLFPKRIDFVLGSRLGHTLGKAVFESIIDEANFDVLNNQMRKNFDGLLRRMESRFMGMGGNIPGKLWIVSSESDGSSNINKVVDDYRNNPGVLVIQEPIWAVKSFKYGKETFPVYKGSDNRPPELIDSSNKHLLTQEENNCIQVPVEHRGAFEADIYEALRDLAGIPVGSSYKLFRMKERMYKAMKLTLLFPETLRLDFDDDTDQIQNYLKIDGYFRSPLSKKSPRHIHIDIGITGDRLGIAASYVSGHQERRVRDEHTWQEVVDSVPLVITEWCIGIEPTPGKQIPLYKIRLFIRWLSQQNYPIARITLDGYQSVDMIQLLTKMGYSAGQLSLDRTPIPYTKFRNSVYEGMCSVPKNNVLSKECLELEVTPDGKKIDHPIGGSKDIADAVAGSAYSAMTSANQTRFEEFLDYESPSHESGISENLKTVFWDKNK